MPIIIAENAGRLLALARLAVGLTQRQLAEKLGVSLRTMARWQATESRPTSRDLAKLARLVYPKDAALAAELAHESGQTLEALGLVKPPPPPLPPPAPVVAPPPPPAPPPLAPRLLVESVVCAAATALDMTPNAIRPAVQAAFDRAREMRLAVEVVSDALQGDTKPKSAGKSRG